MQRSLDGKRENEFSLEGRQARPIGVAFRLGRDSGGRSGNLTNGDPATRVGSARKETEGSLSGRGQCGIRVCDPLCRWRNRGPGRRWQDILGYSAY